MVNKARCGAESPITAVNLEEFGPAEDRLREAAISTGTFNKAVIYLSSEHKRGDWDSVRLTDAASKELILTATEPHSDLSDTLQFVADSGKVPVDEADDKLKKCVGHRSLLQANCSPTRATSSTLRSTADSRRYPHFPYKTVPSDLPVGTYADVDMNSCWYSASQVTYASCSDL